MPPTDWMYDDRRQVGLDFEEPGQAATYDARQNADVSEDVALLEKLGVGSQHVLADLGCGTGVFLCEAAKRCSRAIGVDISTQMLAVAKQRCTAANLANVAFVQDGFLSFDPPPASLDFVTSKFAFHHLPDFWKAKALVRINRMLKPGGVFFLRDVVFSVAPAAIDQAVEDWIGWMTGNTGYTRADVVTHVRDEHSTFDWIIEGLLARSGFKILWREIDGATYADYCCEKAEAV
jgi:cyclopropane fatty-acyl-phospholipid synthase-like methyltransferase